MARAELETLYREVTAVRFAFIRRGEVSIREVYAAVKDRHPELCDDTYLCSTNCKSRAHQPEWKHVIRGALKEMKRRGEPITNSASRGVWLFGAPASATPSLTVETDAVEGRQRLILHRRRERRPRIVRAKKRAVYLATGRLSCEVCDFDFAVTYGERGDGFAECHHCVPLAVLDGVTPTRLADLAIVCANCHRMFHWRSPMPTVAELRREVMSRRPVR